MQRARIALVLLVATFRLHSAAAGTVALRWDPPERRADRIVVQVLDRNGMLLATTTVPVDTGNARAALGEIPPGASTIVLSTPRHSPCTLATDGDAECVLAALPVVRPFGASPGRLWIRKVESEPFVAVPPLTPDWGEAGFAVPRGRFDVVRARDGSAAVLAVQTTAEALRETSSTDPAAAELRGRLVNPDGTPFEGAFSLAVEELPASDARAERRNAWASFYAKNGVEAGPRNAFRVLPLAADPLTFRVEVPGKQALRFGTVRQGAGRTVDVGALRVLSGGRLTISLRLETAKIAPETLLDLQARLLRSDPGAGPTGSEDRPEPRRGRIGAGRALELSSLPYGTYRLSLSDGELDLGTENVAVQTERTTLDWAVTDETVAGRVTDVTGEPVPGAKIEVHRPARATVTSDEDGRFRATFPHAGGEVVVRAGLPGSALPESQVVDPRSPGAQDLAFRLPAARIDATIRSATDQKAIPGAHLLLVVESSGRKAHLSLEADTEGAVHAIGLPEGHAEVRAYARGYVAWGPTEVTLSADSPEEPLDIEMRRSGALAGIVLGEAGQPLPGALVHGPLLGSVEATSAQSVAGPDGRFEVEAPDDRPSVLAVWARGYRLGCVIVTPGPQAATVELQPIGSHADVEIRTAEGEELDRAAWSLVAGGTPVDEVTVEQAFLSNGCPLYALTRSNVRLGGCLMPGRYALSLTSWDGKQMRTFLTDEFDPTPGGVLRVIARPR